MKNDAQRWFDDTGLPPGLSSKREKVQKALARIEQRYQTLFDSSSVSLWECDCSLLRREIDRLSHAGVGDVHVLIDTNPDFVDRAAGLVKVLTLNAASLKLFEADRMEQLLLSHDTIIASAGRSIVRLFLHSFVDGNQSVEHEVTLRTLKGNRRDVLVRATLGAPGCSDAPLILSFVDLTGRRSAEEALRNFILQSPEAIVVADESGRVVEFNRCAEELTGIVASTAVGTELWRLGVMVSSLSMAPDALERLVETALRGDLREQKISPRHRAWAGVIRRADRSERRIEVSVFGIHASRGMRIACLARDVTERVAAEEEIGRLQEQVHQAKKMEALGRLAGGVAHDFNNLLTSIIANADLLLMDAAVSGGVREVVEEIEMASYRAADLTQRLLSFSRKQTPEQKMIDLNVAVADVEKMLRRIIGEDIRLSCFLEASSATVLAAPAQIEQILLNLAINARDAMPEGGSITIATSSVARPKGGTGGDRVCLSVTDTGCGMPDDVKSHLFEPFFTTKDPGRGTGLGLATVYGIVQQMGGEISVDSAVGRGTTVLVTFPIASGIAGSGGVVTPQAPVTRGCGDIIVAEDDETLLKVIVKTLQTGGYTVHGFSDPLEALRFATTEATCVDLLVADLVMPSMSGVQLASGVLEAWAGAKLLYISGYPGELDRKAACPIAGDGYLSKPFTLAELTLKVREVLGGTRPPGRPES